MSPIDEKSNPPTTADTATRKIPGADFLWLIVLFAGIRVFVFTAGFPFFTNIDELLHYDVVCRYRQGQPLRVFDAPSKETCRTALLYFSPEFVMPQKPGSVLKPGWAVPNFDELPEFAAEMQSMANRTNHEATSPLVYYFTAAVWSRIGEYLSVKGLSLLYWLRLLNVLAVMFLVWTAFHFTRTWFPNRPELPVAVALLIAAMPQDVFYSLSPDPISACAWFATLHLLLLAARDNASLATSILAGAMLALAMGIKSSNAVLLVPACLVTLRMLLGRGNIYSPWIRISRVASLWLAAGLPLAAWMAWNKRTLGDWTATKDRFQALTWTTKPLAQWLEHPIFSIEGTSWFLARLTETFWRGEITWHMQVMQRDWMDWLYLATSALFVTTSILAAAATLRKPKTDPSEPWGLLIAVLLASVAWLAFLSVAFDFGQCLYPSQAAPYFISGRLIFGASLPFAILFVHGLSLWLKWTRLPIRPLSVIIVLAAVVTLGELQLSIPVFSSPCNWYRIWP